MWFCGRVLLECISSLLVRTFVPSFCVGTFVMLLLFFLSSRRFSSSDARGCSLFWCSILFAELVWRGRAPGGSSSCLGLVLLG